MSIVPGTVWVESFGTLESVAITGFFRETVVFAAFATEVGIGLGISEASTVEDTFNKSNNNDIYIV